MNRATPRFLLLAALCAFPTLGLAQETVPPLHVLAETFRDEARTRLEAGVPSVDPVERLRPGRFLRVLEGPGLELLAFESTHEDELAFGLGLDLARALRQPRTDGEPAIEALLTGRVALEEDLNPDDHLAASLRLRWAGTRAVGPGVSRQALADDLELPDVEVLSALDSERFTRLVEGFDPSATSALAADPDFAELSDRYLAGLAPRLASELAWAFDLHAGMEATQDFSSRQVVLGAGLASRLVSHDPESKASRLDLFDLPAACLRWLAGEDERLRLTGQALPAVTCGLEVVDAARDEVRGSLTEDESFLRARLEVEFASLAFRLAERPVELRARWRFFQELDAPAAVDRSGTDDSSHLELRLAARNGWFLSYAAGELPLDPQYDSTWTIGYALGL